MTKYQTLVSDLAVQSKLTPAEVTTILSLEPHASVAACWKAALLVFVRTGNLYDALMALLECMVGTARLSGTDRIIGDTLIYVVTRAQASGNDLFLPCLFKLLVGLVMGGDLLSLVLEFLKCIAGGGTEPPPPSGEIPEFKPNPVSRCT